MSYQSSSNVCGMPFRKTPRSGQMAVFDRVIKNQTEKTLNVQLPTGYGKSFVSAGVYSILKKQNRINRLLIIVPTTAQFDQYVKDAPNDFRDACVDGPLVITDVSYLGQEAVKHHSRGTRQIFIMTIQSLSNPCGRNLVQDLFQRGSWMITVDEYHHYGIDKSWGESVKILPYQFLLAMSATPYRPGDDSAFGSPDEKVSYRKAADDCCVKKLRSHSYVYKIDAVMPNGEILTMTTDDLVKDAGGCSPETIENHRIKRKMRWSPKYISPLVSHPIERMISERIRTGHKLQVIVGAMCVSHADMVCEQIRAMYPELSVDWVGTGKDGKSNEENKKVIEKFCPQKDNNGRRNPVLDILVHVGMAGEGLDSIYVSEVVHLNKASINNSNNQENGRAARYLPGVIGNINFDSCSEYAKNGYVGYAIMDAMDNVPPTPDEVDESEKEKTDSDYTPLPVEPAINIWNLELESIDSGSPEILRMAKALAEVAPEYKGDIGKTESYLHECAIKHYIKMREDECKQFNEKSIMQQWKDQVSNSVSYVTKLVIRKMKSSDDVRLDKSVVGDIVKRINGRKKKVLGGIQNDITILKQHYQWVKNLETDLLNSSEIPSWLL